MDVLLKPELEELVSRKVQSGEYPNTTAVLEEGLRLLEARDRAGARLETLILEAEESGPAAELIEGDWDAIRREVHQTP